MGLPVGLKEEFCLKYKSLEIGRLKTENGEWIFRYSQEFKQQASDFNILADFPNVDKEYRSKELWPMFVYRIPGLNQPRIQKIIKDENIDKNSEVDLLRRFGRKSINNPFELKAL